MLEKTTEDFNWVTSVSALLEILDVILDEDTNQSSFDATSKGPSALSNIV